MNAAVLSRHGAANETVVESPSLGTTAPTEFAAAANAGGFFVPQHRLQLRGTLPGIAEVKCLDCGRLWRVPRWLIDDGLVVATVPVPRWNWSAAKSRPSDVTG